MIKLNEEKIECGHFPDGTLLIKKDVSECGENSKNTKITWLFENNEELVTLIFLTKHLRSHGIENIHLNLPYIPNARQDRTKTSEDVFTLKYFAETINWLNFKSVTVLDPHSSVSEALINRIVVTSAEENVKAVVNEIEKSGRTLMMFYPDEGAMKRYAGMVNKPYAFGIKKRDWKTGQIQGLDVAGATEQIAGSDILIVDDISSRGGTFYHAAKKLKELGAANIYLYISHCENTILEGEVLTSGLIERVFTTNSIFTKEHEKITVIE